MKRAASTRGGGVTARSLAIWFVALLAVTAAVAVLCSLAGQYRLTPEIWRVRLFRAGAAAVVGAALAVAGLALQALLRNPLAEPYILGISSGAGVGVLCGLALAASLALRIRDQGGVQPVAQLLVYPMLDDRTTLRSDIADKEHLVWNQGSNITGWGHTWATRGK